MTKKLLSTVQSRIGLLISVIGILVVISGTISGASTLGFIGSISRFSIWSVFLFTIPFIISVFVENKFLKILQVLIFFMVGMINLLDAYQEFYGPAMFLAGWLVMRHYGFLENHTIAKNAIILIVLVGLSQASEVLYVKENEGVYAGFTTLLFALFLILLLIIVWRDMVLQQEFLKKRNQTLEMNYSKLADQLNTIEEEKKPFDLKALKVSPAEERVIETLTVYRASNREIAERLNIAESTVKLHLYNIYNKIGVDNRFSIIELCKYNYN
ncbi:MAG: response regulator transcription factor [Spirochaetales bacterium]|nr:response regulator transcription factor [Spirochaetales bacterium]